MISKHMQIMFSFLLVFMTTHMRCLEEGICKDVTLGDCHFDEDQIIAEYHMPNAIKCQENCVLFANCKVFNFDGTKSEANCLLLKYDYRQQCENDAAPVDRQVESCLASSEETCDRIMEEKCEYLGKELYKSSPGSIVGSSHCHDFCTVYDHCKYWYYVGDGKVCYLYDSSDRVCQAIGGGQKPSIEQCMQDNNITTSTPHSTTTYTGTTTTPDGKCPYTVFKGYEEDLVPLGPHDICCDTGTCLNNNFYCNDWEFEEDGAKISQSKNNEPATMLLDDLEVQGVDFNGTMKVDKNVDADWIGISFGFQDIRNFFVVLSPGDRNPTHKDHWRVTQVKSTTGDTNKDMANAITYSEESVDGQTEVLWRDSNDGNGWQFDVDYFWKLQYRPLLGKLRVRIYENSLDNLLFDTQVVIFDPITNFGKFGIFARSQPSVNWFDMSYECNEELNI